MTFAELKKELDKNKIRPLYVFTGEEREVMLNYIKRMSGTKPPQVVSDIKTLLPHLTSPSLFNIGRQLYVVNNSKEEIDLARLLRVIPANKTVVLCFDSIDKRTKFYKEASDVLVEFKKFSEKQLVSYIKSKIDVDSALAEVIAMYCGNSVSRIDFECDKLVMLGEQVTLDIVNEVIASSVEDCIFDMIDAVAGRKKVDTFDQYSDLMYLGESPIKILSLLYTKYKQIFLVQCYYQLENAELCAKTGLTFFQVNQAKKFIGRVSSEDLLDNLRKVQRTEVAIKTGKVDQHLALQNLLIDLLH